MNHAPNTPMRRPIDEAVIELLRVDPGLGIGDLATSLGVTATAVRQRLDRLMQDGIVERTSRPGPRGRPAHAYSLTLRGRRTGGDNFQDLALVLWREVRSIREPAVRQGLLNRIGTALAGLYRDRVAGLTPHDRLGSIAELMRGKSISCDVEASGGLSTLTSYSCPFPELAEQDRGICAAERVMLQELAGGTVTLAECRLDGGSCCRFTASGARPSAAVTSAAAEGPGVENPGGAASNAGRTRADANARAEMKGAIR